MQKQEDQIIFGRHDPSPLTIAKHGFDPLRYMNSRLANEIMRLLNQFYPGYPWMVTANIEQGVAYFSLPALMGNNSYILHADKIATAADMIAQIKGGAGEVLECYRLPRKRMDAALYSEAKLLVPRQYQRRTVPR